MDMDEKIDTETRERMLEALEQAMAYGEEHRGRMEKRMWRKVSIPCSLHDAVSALTKAELDEIRRNYYLKNLSSLRKADMAAEISRMIPLRFESVLYSLDKSRYDIVKTVVDNSGFLPVDGIPYENAKSFMEHSVLFPGVVNGKKGMFMPVELMGIFSKLDERELERVALRNTEWISLTHGMLYYYGVMPAWTAKTKLEELTGKEIDFIEFVKVMDFACDFYGQANRTYYGYQHDMVIDPEEVVAQQRSRPNVDYRKFTRKQLIKAGEPDYYGRTPQMRSLINYLLEHFSLTEVETKEMASQINNIIISGSRPNLIFEYLLSCVEFPSFEFSQELAGKVTELYNNTHQWALKGHAPSDLFKKEKKFMSPLPAEPFKIFQPSAEKPDKDNAKVGRNDPCPCGSGKKYKKCCGAS